MIVMMMMIMMTKIWVTFRRDFERMASHQASSRAPDESCLCASSWSCAGGSSGSSGSSDQAAEWALMYGYHAAQNRRHRTPSAHTPPQGSSILKMEEFTGGKPGVWILFWPSRVVYLASRVLKINHRSNPTNSQSGFWTFYHSRPCLNGGGSFGVSQRNDQSLDANTELADILMYNIT